MKKYVLPFFLLFLLVGCQQNQSSKEIRNEASDIYSAIKSKVKDNVVLTEDDHKEIDRFKEQYVSNYKDYPNDEELISEMENLINSYNFYNVAVGLNDKVGMKLYKKNLNESIVSLDKEFNK